jgi:hypothetical protein
MVPFLGSETVVPIHSTGHPLMVLSTLELGGRLGLPESGPM